MSYSCRQYTYIRISDRWRDIDYTQVARRRISVVVLLEALDDHIAYALTSLRLLHTTHALFFGRVNTLPVGIVGCPSLAQVRRKP